MSAIDPDVVHRYGEVSAIDVEMRHHSLEILEVAVGIPFFRQHRPAMAPDVVAQHAVMPGEGLELVVEVPAITPTPMDQHDRVARASDLVVQPRAIDLRETGLDLRLREPGRGRSSEPARPDDPGQ